jgi:hypothetical protein
MGGRPSGREPFGGATYSQSSILRSVGWRQHSDPAKIPVAAGIREDDRLRMVRKENWPQRGAKDAKGRDQPQKAQKSKMI